MMRILPRAGSAALALTTIAAGCGSGGEGGRKAGVGHLAQEAPRSPRPLIAASEVADRRPCLSPGEEAPGAHAFHWTRAAYSGSRGGWWGRGSSAWATDYCKGDRQFLVVIRRLVRLDASPRENAVSLADPRLRRYPLIYAVEVGYMNLTDDEVTGLRDYLRAGGTLIVDDFWGTQEWARFEWNIRRVVGDRPIVELPLDHPLFSAYYQIDTVKQVPARGGGIGRRPTWERDGYTPHVRGIFDDDGRLMVIVNWNTDLGDAWEWAEDPYYPLEYSTYAYEMGANMIVYALSH